MEFDLTKPYCHYFHAFTQIPHGSFHEKALSDYIAAFAQEKGLTYKQDEAGNIIVYKPASEGYEDAAPLMLQAHIDMVCEKNKDVEHDFEKDPLKLKVEDDWLSAEGTTLGADDGAGASYIMAILADDTLKHPALEGVFTVQEEVGLLGSMMIKKEDIQSHRCISLDGGGETRTLLSSAGGCEVHVISEMARKDNDLPCYTISIRGLLGGHSGGCIALERGNAIKSAFRILYEMMLDGTEARIVSVDGGSKDNAIPRECDLTFASSTAYEEMVSSFEKAATIIKTELEFSDAGFAPSFKKEETAEKAVSLEDSLKFIQMLYLMPNGFRHRSMAIEGLTLTSLNVGVIKTEGNTVTTIISIRSALESGIDNLENKIRLLANTFGSKTESSCRYPGWNYSEVSPMRDIYAACVKEQYDTELEVVAGHGGCECGVWSALHSDMDIISMGPIAEAIHTPDERLNLPSFDRAYTLLCSIVESCK